MLRRKVVLIGALGLLMLQLNCQSGPTPSSNNTPIILPLLPTPTEPPATQLKTAAVSGVIKAPTAVVTLSTAAASAPSTSPTAELVRYSPTMESPTPTIAIPSETPMSIPTMSSDKETADDVAEIRRMVTEYWEALNTYDVDHAIAMLEPAYRALEADLIRRDIGQMKLFRVKLGVSEETPPVINDEGDYEIYLSIDTPIDKRKVLMVFRRIEGQWWIVYSDEVE